MPETIFTAKSHREDAVAVMNNRKDQFKQLSQRMAELGGEVIERTEIVLDLNMKLTVAENRAENVAYEKNVPNSRT